VNIVRNEQFFPRVKITTAGSPNAHRAALRDRPGGAGAAPHVDAVVPNSLIQKAGVQTQHGDVFEIDVPLFGRPLRNPLRSASNQTPFQVLTL
jgi:hypothetical protein